MVKFPRNILPSFRGSERGNVATIAALCALPLMIGVGAALESSSMMGKRMQLQNAVDAAALAGAAKVSMGDAAMVTNAAMTTAQSILDEDGRAAVFTVAISDQDGSVTVAGEATHELIFGGLLGKKTEVISANATAEGLMKTPLCILQTGATEMKVDDTAAIQAAGCLIHSNNNITVAGSAKIRATATQAVGTVKGPVSPSGHSGAMNIPDPFTAMDLTPPTACNGKASKVNEPKGILVLAAGVHCDEYKVGKNATLVLQPGEHYFMAKLETKEDAVLRGDDVVLIFGSDDSVNFADNSTVEITARKTGPFAGFLLLTTRDNDEKFTIASSNVRELLGTIYIPNAELEIATAGQVAKDSAWSIIVAKTITIKQNPVLVINIRYAGSGVPVPTGVGPSGGGVRLTD